MCQAGFSLWLVTFTSWMHCSNQPTSCISAKFEFTEKTCKLKHTQCILSDWKQYQGCLEWALDLFQSGFNETLVFAYWATCIGAGQPIMSVKPSSASLYDTRHALTKICNVLVCLSDETTAYSGCSKPSRVRILPFCASLIAQQLQQKWCLNVWASPCHDDDTTSLKQRKCL